jgi:SAM-dependent methyltransferase
MRDQGWRVDGVEISQAAAEVGRNMANLNIFSGGLTDARFPSNHFDYIRANHSFEHMCDPNETLNEIYRILKPGGRLLIGVPNQESLNSAVFGPYWWYRGAPVHPFTYSPSTLSRFLVKHGFNVNRVNYNSDYSGILGSLQIWANRNNGRRSTEGFLINSAPLKVICHWLAKIIDRLRVGDAIEIIATKLEPR